MADSAGWGSPPRAAWPAGCRHRQSGLRVAGKLHWVHVATTGKYTLIWVHPKRGRAGIGAGEVMASMTGIAVHDAWAPYETYQPGAHQLCCAHLLRELTAELAPEAVWPGQAVDALLALKTAADDAHCSPSACRIAALRGF